MMKIYIGYDHGGYELAQEVKEYLSQNYEIEDIGCPSTESCDHAEFGSAVAKKVTETPDSRGIVICGSGVGIGIAANRIRGARCVLANSVELATLSRQHNDANVIAMGGRTKFYDPWQNILEAFLKTEADPSDRHVRRRAQLDKIPQMKKEAKSGLEKKISTKLGSAGKAEWDSFIDSINC